MKRIGKQKASSLNLATTQKKNKNNFERQPFTTPTHPAPVTNTTTDLSGYRQPQPGDMIANVMRSIEAGTTNQPAFTHKKQGNELTAPPRENYQPIINPIRQLTAPRQDSLVKGEIVQTKLTIGRPNDKYEQGAYRYTVQVVRQINRPAPMSMAQGGMVQGQEEEDGLRMKPMPGISEIEAMPEVGELMMNPMVQRQEAIGGGEATAELSGEINRARGGGQPLDSGLQKSIGKAMGADFREVRVHTDERADRLNQSLSARAFTTGQDLFFKKGEYEPGEIQGQSLIAHELSHVVQQRTAGLPLPQRPRSSECQTVTAGVIQMMPAEVDEKTTRGRYGVCTGNRTLLYTAEGAAPPQPEALYDMEEPKYDQNGNEYKIWRANVVLLHCSDNYFRTMSDQEEEEKQQVSLTQWRDDVSTTLKLRRLNEKHAEYLNAADRPLWLGLVTRNDCQQFAKILRLLIVEEAMRVVGQEPKYSHISIDNYEQHWQDVLYDILEPGQQMTHVYSALRRSDVRCWRHSATVVATDGYGMVTLEAHAGQHELRHPAFHIRAGISSFLTDNQYLGAPQTSANDRKVGRNVELKTGREDYERLYDRGDEQISTWFKINRDPSARLNLLLGERRLTDLGRGILLRGQQ